MTEHPTIAVLAGGLATRLGELSQCTPKALLDVQGRPFLAWQLDLFAQGGLDDVVLCVGHHGDQIEAWAAANAPAGMRVRVSRDGPTPRGTGGAIQQALPLLSDPFLVTYGDSYLRCDYAEVLRHFSKARATAQTPPLGLMTVYENGNQYDTSNVIFRDGAIVRYDKRERVPEMRHIDWGLGVLTRQAFERIASDAAFDLAIVYEELVAKGRLAGLDMQERFYEIGSKSGLDELRRVLAPRSNG